MPPVLLISLATLLTWKESIFLTWRQHSCHIPRALPAGIVQNRTTQDSCLFQFISSLTNLGPESKTLPGNAHPPAQQWCEHGNVRSGAWYPKKRGAILANLNRELKFVIFHRSFASNKPLTVQFPKWVKCIIIKKVPPYLPINTRACSAISSCLCSTLPNWMLTTKGGGRFLFVFKPYQQASTSKYWTNRGSIKECTDSKWPGIRAGHSPSVGSITKSSSNCLWNCILTVQLKYFNSYSLPPPLSPATLIKIPSFMPVWTFVQPQN